MMHQLKERNSRRLSLVFATKLLSFCYYTKNKDKLYELVCLTLIIFNNMQHNLDAFMLIVSHEDNIEGIGCIVNMTH